MERNDCYKVPYYKSTEAERPVDTARAAHGGVMVGTCRVGKEEGYNPQGTGGGS